MKSNSQIRILGRHAGGINDLLIGPDDMVLTAGTDGAVRSWTASLDQDADLNAKVPIPFFQLGTTDRYGGASSVQMSALSLDRAGEFLACGLKHGVVEIRDAKSGKLIRTMDNPPNGSRNVCDFCRIAFNPANANQLLGTNRSDVNLWDVSSGQILWSERQFSTANTCALLRGGSKILVQEWDPYLHLFEWPGGKRIRWQYELMESSYNFLSMRPAPAEAPFDFALAALDADGAHVVAMNIDEEEAVWEAHFSDRQHDFDISQDGSIVVSGGEDGILFVMSNSGEEQAAIDVDDHPLIGAEADAAEIPNSSGIILTTNDLDEDFFYPTAIHRVRILPGNRAAVAALAGGLLLRIDW